MVPPKSKVVNIEKRLPVPCRKERIVLSNVGNEVANILIQSNSFEALFKKIRSRVRIVTKEPPRAAKGVLGRTGRGPDPNNRRIVALQFAWSKIDSRFQLASIMAHEYQHARQVLDRKFTTAEAAPFLTLEQYLVLKWSTEYEAFTFQAKVLKEIEKRMPIFKPCVKKILAGDARLKSFMQGKATHLRSEIVGDYDRKRLSKQYIEDKNNPIKSIKADVDKFLLSKEWENQKKIWSPWL